nr:PREDICTED: uncharacterized protein LOC106706083 [Latimeria chalumnae]|eukprot:XP_014351953.1 PREDICTED: uncharacterized protein LOC106706083 [Latimeria chalumnae]
MAESTPVLFNMEASYLSIIPALHPKYRNHETLLLTVRLSSCGQMAPCGTQIGRLLDGASLASNLYSTLITWFLSLVPTVKMRQKDSVECDLQVPFQVVGLQQAWREDGLALYVGVSPTGEVKESTFMKNRKNRVKEEVRGTSAFYQLVSKFLNQTSLHSVVQWKDELNQHLQNQLYPLLVHVPTVRLSSVISVNPDNKAVEKAFESVNGFYWQTVETDESYCFSAGEIGNRGEAQIELTMTLVFDTLFSDPLALHHTLQMIFISGLDICGVRLLYPQHDLLTSSTGNLPSSYTTKEGDLQPVLALSLRGTNACTVWQNIIGPADPQLASVTDQGSINAMYCKLCSEPLLYSPRLDTRIHWELCVWFGGRVPEDGIVRVGVQNPNKEKSRSNTSSLPWAKRAGFETADHNIQEMAIFRPPATLIATSKAGMFLVVSPTVPPNCYGDVISVCTLRGFVLQGLRRLRLSSKRACMLGISTKLISIFCQTPCSLNMDSKTDSKDPSGELPLHCLILLLRKENASHHMPSLLKGLMNEFAEQGILGAVRRRLLQDTELEVGHCFHIVPYTDSLLEGLGGNFSSVPDPGNITLDMLSIHMYLSDPELEQVVFLTLTGNNGRKNAGNFLRQLLRPAVGKPLHKTDNVHGGFELLGLKWLPQLTRSQVKEITPFEVGDRHWQESIEFLASGTALLCVLRRINAFATLTQILKSCMFKGSMVNNCYGNLESVMSPTPEMAFRQAAMFFTDKELISDPSSRPLLKYIPLPGRCYHVEGKRGHALQTESIFSFMLSEPHLLFSVVLIKPSTWPRHLAKILRKLNLEKFNVVGLKLLTLNTEMASRLTTPSVQQDASLLQSHLSYLTSGSSIALCVQRENAIKKLLDLLGQDDPQECRTQGQFLWRAQYGTDLIQNGLYGSLSYQGAVCDVEVFFQEGLCCPETLLMEEELIHAVKSDPLICLDFPKKRKLIKCSGNCHVDFITSTRLPTEMLFQSALCQTTCLLLPSLFLRGHHHPPYIELLDQLIRSEFVLTGVRLTVMDEAQARHIVDILHIAEGLLSVVSLLSEGPCLILALQRDNALSCCDSLLDSLSWEKMDLQKYRQYLIYPKNEQQAEDLLCCLFDSLAPHSIHQIVSQDF